MRLDKKNKIMCSRRNRVRKHISGTAERLRLTVHFSGKHIYAQCINDDLGITVVALTTLDKDLRGKCCSNVAGAAVLGKAFAEKAVKAGVSEVVFDRGARRYHGCVKMFADAAREGGLVF